MLECEDCGILIERPARGRPPRRCKKCAADVKVARKRERRREAEAREAVENGERVRALRWEM